MSGTMEVIHFEAPPPVLLPGETARATLAVGLGREAPERVWVGFSARDPLGRWHDAPAREVELPHGADSVAIEVRWTVPDTAASGFYRTVTALWDAPPGEGDATRLLSIDRSDGLRVTRRRSYADRLDTEHWMRGDHPLGRGLLLPENVHAGEDTVTLMLPAGESSGAEIRTADRLGPGRYTARLRTPLAPGTLTAFFLYEDRPEGNDEIDIEILNDASRRVLLTVWRSGEMVHQSQIVLPFDPTAAFHDYAIDRRPDTLRVLIDDVVVAQWTEDLPHTTMRLMVNVWWPTWLDGAPLTSPAQVLVERIHW